MSTRVYYNEFDPKTAAWLRELIKQGHLPAGDVDERSIIDVRGSDLDGYTQAHFFAGIGGWPYALQLAGWPTTKPVWTGSCPCQPFSVAGKGLGTKDARHLWPEMFRLICECRPTTVFGEQVASKAGREWLSGVFTDLEGMGYAAAGADLCAAGVGAPHIRQRLFWVAYGEHDGSYREIGATSIADRDRPHGRVSIGSGDAVGGPRHPESIGRTGRAHDENSGRREFAFGCASAGCADRLCHAASAGSFPGAHGGVCGGEEGAGAWDGESERSGDACRLQHPTRVGRQQRRAEPGERGAECGCSAGSGLLHPIGEGLERHAGHGRDGSEPGRDDPQSDGPITPAGFWSDYDILPFRDGKARRVEPGTFPLAHGIPARVVKLRGYGNAIVHQVAAEFIGAFMDLEIAP